MITMTIAEPLNVHVNKTQIMFFFHSEITTKTPWMEEQSLTKDVTLLIDGARLCEKR
jgi:hypothetical protein